VGQDHTRPTSTIASLRFDSDKAGACFATVTGFYVQATGEPRQRLTIACEGKQLAQFETPGAFIEWAFHRLDGNRLFVSWERGTGGELTVFKIPPNAPAKPIFDKWETYVPEGLWEPDVILVYTGTRFFGPVKTPTKPDVYVWNGNEYKLDSSWNWSTNMRWQDRFCILDAKLLNCPATVTHH